MATIKAYTDISQSKKLAEILPLETSDMIYTITNGYHTPFVRIEKVNELTEDDICAWSLAALLSVLPRPSLHRTTSGKWHSDAEPNRLYFSKQFENPIDACVDMIIKLKEDGYIKL